MRDGERTRVAGSLARSMRARRAAALAVVVLVACVATIVRRRAGRVRGVQRADRRLPLRRHHRARRHHRGARDDRLRLRRRAQARDLPLVPVRTDQSGKDGYDRVYPLDVVSVSGSEGTPAQYTVEEDGDNERIKIGDPDQTITGEHTYDIVYRVRGER